MSPWDIVVRNQLFSMTFADTTFRRLQVFRLTPVRHRLSEERIFERILQDDGCYRLVFLSGPYVSILRESLDFDRRFMLDTFDWRKGHSKRITHVRNYFSSPVRLLLI